MAIINIYSKRQRKIRGEVNDVYQYNNIPHALRVQIIKIITDSIGFPSSNERYTSYMLHLTATNLLFLLKCEKNIK